MKGLGVPGQFFYIKNNFPVTVNITTSGARFTKNILRQSYDCLTIIPKLPSTYDGRLIYKTSYNEWKVFHSRAKS